MFARRTFCAVLVAVSLALVSALSSRAVYANAPYRVLHAFDYNTEGQPIAIASAGDGTYFVLTQNNGAGALFHVLGESGVVKVADLPRSLYTMMRASDGNLYLTGLPDDDIIYKLTPTGELSVLADCEAVTTTSCFFTTGPLVEGGPDGDLYGAAEYGGDNGLGLIYKISKSGQITVLANLGYYGPQNPVGSVVVEPDGTVFAATQNISGVQAAVIRVDPGADPYAPPAIVHSFDDGTTPGTNLMGLVEGGDGYLYGSTDRYVFRLSPSMSGFEIISVAHGYDVMTLITGPDVRVYGGTWSSVFQIDPVTHATTDLKSTDRALDGTTTSGLTLNEDATTLFGVNAVGGPLDGGTLFRLFLPASNDHPPTAVATATPNPAEATSAAGATVTLSGAGSSDPDGEDMLFTWTGAFGTIAGVTANVTFPIGSTTVTLTVNDRHSHVVSTDLVVTVHDTTPPALTLPSPISVPSTSAAGATVSFTASAFDIVDGAVAVACSSPSPSVFPIGTTTVSCSAADAHGNTGVGSFTITVLNAQPANGLNRFVAFSRDHTWLRAGAAVLSGDVGANEPRLHAHVPVPDDGDRDNVTMRVGVGAQVAGTESRVVGDTVLLLNRASVYDVVDNVLINRRASVLGSISSPMATPFLTMPAAPTVAPGTTAIAVAKNRTMTLAAGAYDTVHVGHGATLILTGGLYQMRSLDVDAHATVVFHAASEIRIATELDTNARAKLILDPAVAGLRASHVVIYVAGDDTVCHHADADQDGDDAGQVSVHMGSQSVVQANIYAVNGTVWLKSGTQATGAFVGVHVRVGVNAVLTLDSAF
jgi:uncharacterized repeat protein (TIGR03803 family)